MYKKVKGNKHKGENGVSVQFFRIVGEKGDEGIIQNGPLGSQVHTLDLLDFSKKSLHEGTAQSTVDELNSMLERSRG